MVCPLKAFIRPHAVLVDLGVNIDSRQLTMADPVAALRRSCLFQLRQLRMVRSSLTSEAAKSRHWYICIRQQPSLQQSTVRDQCMTACPADETPESRLSRTQQRVS